MTTAYGSRRVPEISLRHRLRIAREEAGMEQIELAEKMGVSRNTVSSAEKGRTEPRRIVINAWALATGFDAEWIRTGTSSQYGVDPDGGGAQTGEATRPADYQSVSLNSTMGFAA